MPKAGEMRKSQEDQLSRRKKHHADVKVGKSSLNNKST
jgi:hypothetical protein